MNNSKKNVYALHNIKALLSIKSQICIAYSQGFQPRISEQRLFKAAGRK